MPDFDEVCRREAPHVLGALVRKFGDFDGGEDALQEALLAAARQWPTEGVPANPRGWLITVASRRLIDELRSDRARAEREERDAFEAPRGALLAPPADVDVVIDRDDSLDLLLLCCHPALAPASQVALTLRAVGGLTTRQIAAAYLVPEATMAQRISRAKSQLRSAGARFGPLDEDDPHLAARWAGVLHVLYLVFNEGYTSSGGPRLVDVSLTAEAIRLTREVCRARPRDAEAAGLLALMLLTDARRPARLDAAGDLVALADQDRGRWLGDRITEGVALLERVLPIGPTGPYQLQAAIAAVHDEAPTWPETDWPQIAALYRMLDEIAPSPTVTLNRAVAVAMTFGPRAGLALLAPLDDQPRMRRHHRLHAVRAHLLELAGDRDAALAAYADAARLTASRPEQRYLNARAEALRRPESRSSGRR